MADFTTRFDFGRHVYIDQDRDLRGVVTGFCWKSEDGPTIAVEWMHNGAAQSAWFQPWRLLDAD